MAWQIVKAPLNAQSWISSSCNTETLKGLVNIYSQNINLTCEFSYNFTVQCSQSSSLISHGRHSVCSAPLLAGEYDDWPRNVIHSATKATFMMFHSSNIAYYRWNKVLSHLIQMKQQVTQNLHCHQNPHSQFCLHGFIKIQTCATAFAFFYETRATFHKISQIIIKDFHLSYLSDNIRITWRKTEYFQSLCSLDYVVFFPM